MSIQYMLEILDRAHHGPLCTEKEWNTKIIPTSISQKLKEHGLQNTYDPNNIVNTDDALADEFFKAGFELALEMGFFCVETERIIRVTQDELRFALRNAPSEIVFGEGRDRVVMKHRQMEDPYPPIVDASLGIVVSEDIWVQLMQGIVQNREIDVFEGGSLSTIFGHHILGGSPYETLAGRYEAQLKREVLWRAGRPGMCTDGVISSTTEYGQLGGYGVAGGFDPAKSTAIILIPNEMSTNYITFHKVIHSVNCGSRKRLCMASMIGGYPGGPEGIALSQIAGFLLQFAIHEADFAGLDVMDVSYSGSCGRKGLWAQSIPCQAIGRNTHLLKSFTPNQVAGPCTEMVLYESAAAMLTLCTSGAEFTVEPRSGGGRYTDDLTPLECKFCAEVYKRSAGMTRKQANDIVKVLMPKYEDKLKSPDKGKSCHECYDLKALKPTQEWLDIYLKVKKELIALGIPLEYP